MENHHVILQPLDKLQGYFEYLPPKNELKDLHSAKQRVFAEETANGKITATLVNTQRAQIQFFHCMTDFQIPDKVRSIIKAKIDNENEGDEEEVLPGN